MTTGHYAMLSKYRLLARLGSGGMAEVFLVLSEGPNGFNKLQVLKLMRSDLTDQERPEFLQMFQDESRLAARLNHPNIVQSFEVGAEDGQPFIVMEFLEGQPLHRVQQRARHLGGGFSRESQLFVLCQVLEGLDYAHRLTDYDGKELHIVHRDVSPQNVFITYSGQTKLVDFGVAKTLESSKTRAGVVKGKVAYMSPEQVMGGPIDHRADLFSVGVLLWEAIAGQPMHAELSVYESLNRLVKGERPSLREIVPDISPELERIVHRALEFDREKRYPDAESFRNDLLSYLESRGKTRARDVGDAVAKLFQRERSELSQIIRGAMSSTAGERDTALALVHITRRLPMAGAMRPSDPPEPGIETPTTRDSQPGIAIEQVKREVAKKKAPLGSWKLSALSAAVLLAVIAFVVSRSDLSGARSAARVEGTPLSPSDLERDPVPASVRVDIDVEPRSASLRLDGRMLNQNPYHSTEPRDELQHVLSVSAPGFAPLQRIVRFDRDVAVKLELTKEVEPPGTPSSMPPAAAEPRRPRRTGSGAAGPSITPAPNDDYVDLPPPRRIRRSAPELDKSDPWQTGGGR